MTGDRALGGWRAWPDVADGVRWVVDDDRVLVVDGSTQAVTELTGVEAVIWRAVVARFDARTLLEIVRRGLRVSGDDAGARVRDILRRWTALGLLAGTGEGGRG